MGMTPNYTRVENSSLAPSASTSLPPSRRQLIARQLNTSASAKEGKFICSSINSIRISISISGGNLCVLAFWSLLLSSIATQSTVSLMVDGE